MTLLFLLLSSFSTWNSPLGANPRPDSLIGPFRVEIMPRGESKTLRLLMDNPRQEQVTLELFDSRGKLVFARQLRPQPRFVLHYDLKYLPEGEYLLVLKRPRKETFQPIRLEGGRLLVDPEQRGLVHEPLITRNGEFLDVSLMAGDLPRVTIQIQNAEGEPLHQEVYQRQPVILRHFDLSLLAEGNYRVVVDTGFRRFEKAFQIRR